MSQPQQFILFRQGKNAIGPFTDIELAAAHIGTEKLLGYAVIPLVSPEGRHEVASDSRTPVVRTGRSSLLVTTAMLDRMMVATPSSKSQDLLINIGESHNWTQQPYGSMALYMNNNFIFRWENGWSEEYAAKMFMEVFTQVNPTFGDNANAKIACIKALRRMFGIGLRETKDIIDSHIPPRAAF